MSTQQIMSLQHSMVKHVVRLRQNHDYRDEHNSVVISGIKEVREVCAHVHPKLLMVYDETFIPKGVKADEVLIVSESIMQKVSGTQSPEGILAVVEKPKAHSMKDLKYIVALDGVGDPGNLGTIIRTALALGWDGVFILDQSCDPFNDKALRASRGATFKIPLARGNWKQLEELIQKNHLQALVADLKGTPVSAVQPKEGTLLILGNEAHGISSQAAAQCTKITIPMAPAMESLNVAVAGGILMQALRCL